MLAGVAISAPSRLLKEAADLLGPSISHARISVKALGCLGLIELWPRRDEAGLHHDGLTTNLKYERGITAF